MSTNFNQVELLENNNQKITVQASPVGKFFYYFIFIFIIPIFFHVHRLNWLRSQKEKALQMLSDIDSKLTQRFDSLDNQLKVAKAALAHEKNIYLEVANIRSQATAKNRLNSQESVNQIQQKDQLISGLASRFNAVLENYPQVQGIKQMQDLMQNVKEIEADLDATRRFYNAVVQTYNARIRSYPTNVVSNNPKNNFFRFPMFEAEASKRQNVSLDF